MYISTVSSNSLTMIFWACISPFLGLPFVSYLIDEKTKVGRIKLAIASAIGYGLGATVVWSLTHLIANYK